MLLSCCLGHRLTLLLARLQQTFRQERILPLIYRFSTMPYDKKPSNSDILPKPSAR